jgi:hypothetical protein
VQQQGKDTGPAEPDPQFVQQVMGGPAAAVVDPNKTSEDGDPFLIALALQLVSQGYTIMVVTDDTNTTPIRMSVTDACDLLGVPWCGWADFLSYVDKQA